MSHITVEILLDQFESHPLRLRDSDLTIHGANISATIDVSDFAMEHGDQLDHYLDALEAAVATSPFRLHYQIIVQEISPPVLSVDLSRLRLREVNFTSTNLESSRVTGALTVTGCVIDASLPPVSVGPGELFRYPPGQAARELGISDAKDLLILRWGLTQDARHLGQAFLWLERRYPNTESVLARLLKGLPARPAKRPRWSP